MTERNLDFDRIINRKNTDCLKYDFAVKRGMPADVLPLWVADMDFETSSYIEDALVERAKMGIYGYSDAQTPYFEAVAGWMKRHHNWEPKEEWLIKTPGVVFALAMAVKAYTAPGDAVLIQSPVYYPFSEVIADNGRRVVSSTLVLGDDNCYHMDVADFEERLKAENVKLFFLCNPHNPVGRVWTKEELTAIGFEVTLDKVDFETYQQSLESGQFDLVVGGWKCSEVTDLTPFFGTGGSLNYIGYSDADMDTLLTAARTAVGEGQTLLAYSSLQKKLAEELPYISIAYRNQAVFASKNIGGEVHPVESNVFRGIEAWTYQKGE